MSTIDACSSIYIKLTLHTYLSTNRSLFYTHFEVDRTVNLLCLSNIRREDNNYILTRNLYEYEEYHEKNGTL